MKNPITLKKVKDSSIDLGGALTGFVGANLLSKQVIKKDTPIVNGIGLAAGILANGAVANSFVKNLATGLALYFGVKLMQNGVSGVEGLSGLPSEIKSVIAKLVPNLGNADVDGYENALAQLETNELRLLAGSFGNPGAIYTPPVATGSGLLVY